MATALKSVEMLLRPALQRIRPESLTRTLCNSRIRFQENKDGDPPKEPAAPKQRISKEEKQKQAKEKLNLLLETMAKDTSMKPAESKLNLATPRLREKRRREKAPKQAEVVDPAMKKAVEDVSSAYPLKKDSMKQALLEKLEEVAKETEIAKVEPPKPNKEKAAELNSLLNTLKVEKPQRRRNEPVLGPMKVEEVFAGKPSDIFKNAQFLPNDSIPKLAIWDKLAQKELELAVTHPPANGFERMIHWTRQGKLWNFPIDNEQGWEEEKDIGFHEHIFLERHLDPWCPKRGPLRHFMELVCVGLSKNPYLTVAKKKEHIFWFRDFFNAQRKILVDTGVIPDESATSKSAPRISV